MLRLIISALCAALLTTACASELPPDPGTETNAQQQPPKQETPPATTTTTSKLDPAVWNGVYNAPDFGLFEVDHVEAKVIVFLGTPVLDFEHFGLTDKDIKEFDVPNHRLYGCKASYCAWFTKVE